MIQSRASSFKQAICIAFFDRYKRSKQGFGGWVVACLCIENGAINSWFLCSAPKLLSNNVLHIMGMIIIMVIIIMIIIAITVRLMCKVGSF